MKKSSPNIAAAGIAIVENSGITVVSTVVVTRSVMITGGIGGIISPVAVALTVWL